MMGLYFFSYHHKFSDSEFGFGSAEIELKKEPGNYTDLMQIAEAISQEQFGERKPHVVIIGFQKFGSSSAKEVLL